VIFCGYLHVFLFFLNNKTKIKLTEQGKIKRRYLMAVLDHHEDL